jgi:hypothetical protein
MSGVGEKTAGLLLEDTVGPPTSVRDRLAIRKQSFSRIRVIFHGLNLKCLLLDYLDKPKRLSLVEFRLEW